MAVAKWGGHFVQIEGWGRGSESPRWIHSGKINPTPSSVMGEMLGKLKIFLFMKTALLSRCFSPRVVLIFLEGMKCSIFTI